MPEYPTLTRAPAPATEIGKRLRYGPSRTEPDTFSPTRSTSEAELDAWNQAFRASPVYLNFMIRNGLPTNGRVTLSRSQQSALEAEMRAAGMTVPPSMHIDQGGNLNQKNRLVKGLAIGAGAATAAFGIPGVVPGLLSGGGAAGGAAGAAGAGQAAGAGTLASTPLGGAYMGPAIGAGMTGSLPAAGGAAATGLAGLSGGDALTGLASGGGAASAAKRLLGGDDSGWQGSAIEAAIAALAGLPGLANSGQSDEEQAISQQIESLLGLQRQRMESQNPLFDAMTKLAMSRLPRSARGE